MTTEHPITPPWALIAKWRKEWTTNTSDRLHQCNYVANQAARWGADQELWACCELLDINGCPSTWIDMLRTARRPKPPSLAEEALAKTEAILNDPGRVLLTEEREALELNRRALKRLQELEQQENNDN